MGRHTATRKNPHAVALGRKGGRANKGKTSEAKAAAARENGKKGGRLPKDLTGRIFGRLTAISPTERRSGGSVIWSCHCQCGNEAFVTSANLKSENTRSCGCLIGELIATHGATRHGVITREYRTWKAMFTRCRNPHSPHFARYGGRGIEICERWRDYAAFLADIGPCPPGYTLERINNDGNYEPSNVRWATQSEQMRNTSRTRFLTHRGVTLCLSDWATRIGTSYLCLYKRLMMGWSVERALTTPVRRSHAATLSKISPVSVDP